MKKLIILLYVLIPLNTLFPQQAEPKKSTEDIIKSLYQENKFDEILSVKDTLKGKYLTPDVCLYIGLSYYLETDYKNALVYLNKGINKKPDYYILLYFKGRVYKDMKKYKEAFDAFDEAIEADNSRSSSLTEEAEMYMEQSKYKEAFKLLKKAVSKKKVLGKAYFLLAEIYYEQRNDPENALKTLYKGKEKNEKDDEYYFSIKFYIGFIERDKKNQTKFF
jgi:tetratricopeptide (TPR) repeat protein